MIKQAWYILAAVVLMTVAAALPAGAATILYPTGVDSSGAPLAGSSYDPHYTLTPDGGISAQAVAMSQSTYWHEWPKPADARWIYTADVFDSGARGWFSYRTTFDLTGYDLSTVFVSFKWLADQYGSAILNGVTKATLVDYDYTSLHDLTINSGFIAGINELRFRIYFPDGGDGLVVSDVAFTGSLVPLPGALALLAPGIAALAVLRRRRKR